MSFEYLEGLKTRREGKTARREGWEGRTPRPDRMERKNTKRREDGRARRKNKTKRDDRT